MSLTVSEGSKGGKTFELHPAGVFAARCTRIIDLGTQTVEWQGESKTRKQLRMFFETEHLLSSGEYAGKPSLISTAPLTASLNEKSKLRKDLESWRGRAFTEAERGRFDLKAVLGKVCMLNIVHTEKDGTKYANISVITPLPPAMKAPPAEALVMFSLEDFKQDVFEGLSENLKAKIQLSPEFRAIADRMSSTKPAEKGGFDDMDDDVPF